MAWVDVQGHVFRRTQPYLCSVVASSIFIYERYEGAPKPHHTVRAFMRLMQSIFYLSKCQFLGATRGLER